MGAPNVGAPGKVVQTESRAQEDHESSAEIFGEIGNDRKVAATLKAQLALRGYSLYELACGGFLVSRWDRSLHCSDLAGVRTFYERLGARA